MNPAHLHLLLNHVPVLGSLLAIVALAYGLVRREWLYSRLALILLVFIALVSVPVYVSGEPAEHALEQGRQMTDAPVEPHEGAATVSFAGLEALGLLAGTVLWRTRRGRIPSSLVLGLVLVAVILVSASTAWTAYLGGQIAHVEMRP